MPISTDIRDLAGKKTGARVTRRSPVDRRQVDQGRQNSADYVHRAYLFYLFERRPTLYLYKENKEKEVFHITS